MPSGCINIINITLRAGSLVIGYPNQNLNFHEITFALIAGHLPALNWAPKLIDCDSSTIKQSTQGIENWYMTHVQSYKTKMFPSLKTCDQWLNADCLTHSSEIYTCSRSKMGTSKGRDRNTLLQYLSSLMVGGDHLLLLAIRRSMIVLMVEYTKDFFPENEKMPQLVW